MKLYIPSVTDSSFSVPDGSTSEDGASLSADVSFESVLGELISFETPMPPHQPGDDARAVNLAIAAVLLPSESAAALIADGGPMEADESPMMGGQASSDAEPDFVSNSKAGHSTVPASHRTQRWQQTASPESVNTLPPVAAPSQPLNHATEPSIEPTEFRTAEAGPASARQIKAKMAGREAMAEGEPIAADSTVDSADLLLPSEAAPEMMEPSGTEYLRSVHADKSSAEPISAEPIDGWRNDQSQSTPWAAPAPAESPEIEPMSAIELEAFSSGLNEARINDGPVIREIVRSVADLDHSADHRREIKLQIHPEELGQLRIAVVEEDGELTASIEASEVITSELLNREKDQLLDLLQENGIDLSKVQISHRDSSRENQQHSFYDLKERQEAMEARFKAEATLSSAAEVSPNRTSDSRINLLV